MGNEKQEEGTWPDRGTPAVEFQATRPAGLLSVLWLLAQMTSAILVLGAIAFLFAWVFPDLEEHAVSALVGLIPLVSFVLIWRSRGAQPQYLIRISRNEFIISRIGTSEDVVISLEDAIVNRVNWVASGRHGMMRLGPALEFCHDDRERTRVALADAMDLWDDAVTEISEPSLVISRQAWDALRSALDRSGNGADD